MDVETRALEDEATAAPPAPAPAPAAATTRDSHTTLQVAAHWPARIALHATALLLAIGVLVAECVLISHSAYTYEWMAGTRIARAPALVITTAAIAAAMANVLLVSVLLRAPPARGLPSYEPLPAGSSGGFLPATLWAAAVESTLLACILVLWVACVGVSGRTEHILRYFDAAGGVWGRCNAVALSFECCSVLVWAASLFLSAKPLTHVVQAWRAQWTAAAACCNRAEASGQPGDGLVKKLRLGLHALTALLAIGALVSQAVFMPHQSSYSFDWMRGQDFAKAPALVIVTSVLALVLACCLLAVRTCAARLLPQWRPATATATSVLPWAAATEPLLAADVLALWVASLGVSAKTAAMLDRAWEPPKVWVHANVVVLVFECCSVLAWAVALLLSAKPLVPLTRDWRARCTAATSGFYEPLGDAENVDAGDDALSASGCPWSGATSGDNTVQPGHVHVACLGLLVSAMPLSVGVLVAQSILMRHAADIWESSGEYKYSYTLRGKDIAAAPALVLATASTALSVAVILVACSVLARVVRLPRWWAKRGLAVWVAGVDVFVVACVLALWAASVGVSGKTAAVLLKYSAPSSAVWVGSNAAVLTLESCSVLVWAAALVSSVRVLATVARAWRAHGAATGGSPTAPGSNKLRLAVLAKLPRLALLLVTMLLAIGVLVAESTLVHHGAEVYIDGYYNYYQWWKGSHFAAAPALVFATAGVALLVACLLLVSLAILDSQRAVCRAPAWAGSSSCVAVWAAGAEATLVAGVLALWVSCVGVSARTVVNLQEHYGTSRVWKHSNTAALVLECCSVLAWAAALALSVRKALRVRAARKASLAASSELRALLHDSDDERGTEPRCGGSTPRTATTSSSGTDKPQPMPVQWTHIALYATAVLVAIGTLVAQGILMDYAGEPDSYPYTYTKGKRVAAAPGLVIFAAALTVLLASTKLAAAVPLLLHLPLLSVVANSPSLQLWVATAEAELAAMVLALWAASVGVSARNAHKMQEAALWPGVWVRCNAAVLAFACISVCLWSAGVALSFRALRLAVHAWHGQQAAAGSGDGPASRAESVSDAA